ncbi:PREDICTED: uncharacterized protein LOC106293508 isoform X1 [Brassica oleracea var. oleracea]|uniref:uncharacterized protein LOC106293508 isoform X1 n=1 Tax=Brassica oleracea var. oleracea TaxID=109376 RepID=UPI0006A6B31E|nr:PREDICTED: uncharacterized protein LOC106293508 isoform X1 [Brassica oleracea var. oleracea]
MFQNRNWEFSISPPSAISRNRSQLSQMDSSSTPNRVSFDNNKDVEDEEEQELATPDSRGKRKEYPTANGANKAPRILPPRSKIWNHYTRTKDKRDKCICHYCKKNFCCKTKSGTKNLLKHISICKQFYSYSDGQSSTQQVIDEEGNVMSAKVSEETFKEATNEMMVIGELPLCWVESVAWKHFYEIRQTCVKEDLNKRDCKDVLAEEGCYEKVV